MNIEQLNTALSQLVNAALQGGCPPGSIITCLECTKLDLHANVRQHTMEQKVIPITRLPPTDRNGGGR